MNRTHAAVVRRMHVTHLESGTLAGEPTGTQRGERPHVFKLVQNILLVHVLRELVRIKEFFMDV